jgi:hypothetical protein
VKAIGQSRGFECFYGQEGIYGIALYQENFDLLTRFELRDIAGFQGLEHKSFLLLRTVAVKAVHVEISLPNIVLHDYGHLEQSKCGRTWDPGDSRL